MQHRQVSKPVLVDPGFGAGHASGPLVIIPVGNQDQIQRGICGIDRPALWLERALANITCGAYLSLMASNRQRASFIIRKGRGDQRPTSAICLADVVRFQHI